MIDQEVKKALLDELELLPDTEQKRVLTFARSLHFKGVPGHVFAEKNYGFNESELNEMEKAILDGCEKIDYHEW